MDMIATSFDMAMLLSTGRFSAFLVSAIASSCRPSQAPEEETGWSPGEVGGQDRGPTTVVRRREAVHRSCVARLGQNPRRGAKLIGVYSGTRLSDHCRA